MQQSLRERILRIAIQLAIFLALMIGIVLRSGSGAISLWEIGVRPLLVFGLGLAFLRGVHWARWPLAACCLAFAWWYAQTTSLASVSPGLRIGTGAGTLLELCCAAVVLAMAPEASPPGPRQGS